MKSNLIKNQEAIDVPSLPIVVRASEFASRELVGALLESQGCLVESSVGIFERAASGVAVVDGERGTVHRGDKGHLETRTSISS